MAKPVTGLITFGTSPGPDSTGSLDTNYSLITAALNDLGTYGNFLQDTSGVANSIVTTTTLGITAALAPGLRVELKVANTNTGATTLTINALAAQAIVNPDGSQLGPGQLQAGGLYTVEYDGTNFQMQGQVFGNSLPANTVMGDGPPILWGYQLGSAGSPSVLTGPVIHVAKYFTGSGGTNYEGGAAWFSTYHEGGTQPSVGLTGYVELDGGAAPCVGVHGRADNHSVAGGSMWAGWMTATDLNNTAVAAINSIESDITIGATRAHANISPAATDANGHIIVNQSGALGAFHGTRALGIYASTISGTETSWYTGLQIGGTNQNAIVAGNANEAIQLNGGTAAANAYAGIRTAGFLTIGADFAGKLTGAVTSRGVNTTYTFQSDVTTEGSGYSTSLSTQAAAFTLANLRHFEANQGTIGAGSSVTNQVGFYISANLTGATNNYGLYGNLAAAANTFNIYCGGTAPIFAAGSLGIFGAGPPAQPTGYGTPTGGSHQGSFAAGTITLPNLAAAVAQLIIDLKTYGFLGA